MCKVPTGMASEQALGAVNEARVPRVAGSVKKAEVARVMRAATLARLAQQVKVVAGGADVLQVVSLSTEVVGRNELFEFLLHFLPSDVE